MHNCVGWIKQKKRSSQVATRVQHKNQCENK